MEEIKALLFDLDGTLLQIDMRAFIPKYFKKLVEKFSSFISRDKMYHQLINSTQVMMNNLDLTKTNREVFLADFIPKIGLKDDFLLSQFERFYREDFPKLGEGIRPNLYAHQVVKKAFEKGFQVVIATNPVFPLVAIKERLKWARVADFNYDLITSYENMHFCKPHPQYFLEVASILKRKPSECLMIGDDVELDLISSAQVGMKTFFTPHSLAVKNLYFKVDFVGSLKDLLALIERKDFFSSLEGRQI